MIKISPESPILAIDPGYELDGFVVWDPVGKTCLEKGKVSHAALAEYMRNNVNAWLMAIEMFQSYGMPVGMEVFNACTWVGRFEEIWQIRDRPSIRAKRPSIKSHHCGAAKAKDSHVRQALIDKYGPIGTMKAPGPLYGVTTDCWSALALATYVTEARLNHIQG